MTSGWARDGRAGSVEARSEGQAAGTAVTGGRDLKESPQAVCCLICPNYCLLAGAGEQGSLQGTGSPWTLRDPLDPTGAKIMGSI